jgi:hypothetical protein
MGYETGGCCRTPNKRQVSLSYVGTDVRDLESCYPMY